LLIARLGLRAGDVTSLTFENIDWEGNRITLTQHKTGRPLILPLLEDVGTAVIDYLRFGRPNCVSPEIFIRHFPPVGPFVSKSLYNMVAGYIGKTGLLERGKKRGPHALRHSLASRLLEKNVPLPVISEILGHANTNTTSAYLAIDINKLRACALEV
jgi:integrase